MGEDSSAETPSQTKSSNDLLDLKHLQNVDEQNLVMFRKKHLFVEMHELDEKEWHETKRWNYGLEEERAGRKWTSAHLPTISVFGMMGFRECLKPELIILDAVADDEVKAADCPGECAAFNRCLKSVAMTIVNHFVRDGQIEPGNAAAALDTLWSHLSLKKIVDHDDILKEAKAQFLREKSKSDLRSAGDLVRTSAEEPIIPGGSSKSHSVKFFAPESATMSRRGLAAGGASLIKVPSLQKFSSFLRSKSPTSRRSKGLVATGKDQDQDQDDDDHDDDDHDQEVEEVHSDATTEGDTDEDQPGHHHHHRGEAGTSAAGPKETKSSTNLSFAAAGPAHLPRRRPTFGGSKTGGVTDAGRKQKGAAAFPPPRHVTSISEGNPQNVMPPKLRRRRSSGTLQKLLSRKRLFEARRYSSTTALFASRKSVVVKLPPLPPENEDPLKPDAEEEAVHILIDDQFDALTSDAVVIVRLAAPVPSGLEERTHMDEVGDDDESPGKVSAASLSAAEEHNGHSPPPPSSHTGEDDDDDDQQTTLNDIPKPPPTKRTETERTPGGTVKKRPQDLLARFIVLVLGPKIDESALTSVSAQLCARRHAEMGAAAAALMQDDAVVRALYESTNPSSLLEAIDLKLSSMRILPRTSRPTKAAVKRRASRMYQQLAELKRVAEAQALARAKEMTTRENPEVVELQNTGGRFVRLEYPEQAAKWGARERDTFTAGFSIGAFLTFAQKYALPLLSGIVLALILANVRAGGYRRWAGVSEHDDDHDDDHGVGLHGGDDDDHVAQARRVLSSGGSPGHPTLFGLRVDGHDVTLHFVVNDVLMALFFGLAVKEIAEAFQPGGSLYPPTRKAVNPLLGTVGGVVGPIVLYFVFIAVAVSSGLLGGYDFLQLARGWGIPTATDISIAWVTAVVLFGSGHPAINYLLLCAVIDDGIGLIIIAVAYPDPDNPLTPGWLLLVVLAMAISLALRKLECARWAVYVFLAGPLAWFGLLYAAVHPSLALCFVVPFMPIKIDSALDDANDRLTILDSTAGGKTTKGEGKGKHHHLSPLHDFEDAVKNFVDFFVLFAFGAVNAGVRLRDAGGYSLVILLTLFFGKTLGMTVGSSVAVALGFPRPEGMSFRHLVVAGVISSVGLTVSLFIAGEAFAGKDQLEGQAKLGALLSLGPALVLVALANFSPNFKRLIGGKRKNDDDDDDDGVHGGGNGGRTTNGGFLLPSFSSKTKKTTTTPNGSKQKKKKPSKHDFKANNTLVPPAFDDDDDDDGNGDPEKGLAVATGLAGDGIPISPKDVLKHKSKKKGRSHEFKDVDYIDYARDYREEDDQEEFLEDAVVANIENTLREIHRIEAQVEKRAGVRRSSSILEGFRHQAHEAHGGHS